MAFHGERLDLTGGARPVVRASGWRTDTEVMELRNGQIRLSLSHVTPILAASS
jgi:hypothetical protein